MYKHLIEGEAQREVGVYSQQFEVNAKVIESQTLTASHGLVWASIFEFLKWCAPAGLAAYCTYEMANFYRAGNKEAAGAFEKIIYVLMTGAALGWAVSKRKD
jgi:hypothetical protein